MKLWWRAIFPILPLGCWLSNHLIPSKYVLFFVISLVPSLKQLLGGRSLGVQCSSSPCCFSESMATEHLSEYCWCSFAHFIPPLSFSIPSFSLWDRNFYDPVVNFWSFQVVLNQSVVSMLPWLFSHSVDSWICRCSGLNTHPHKALTAHLNQMYPPRPFKKLSKCGWKGKCIHRLSKYYCVSLRHRDTLINGRWLKDDPTSWSLKKDFCRLQWNGKKSGKHCSF